MNLAGVSIRLLAATLLTIIAGGLARPQPAAPGPPAVGVVEATRRPITESSEFLGRIEAINRVNVVARVTAFLERRLFEEGAEISKGDELYRLERGPFEADLASKQAQVAQLQATLENAKQTTERARTLLEALPGNSPPTTPPSRTSSASKPRSRPRKPRSRPPGSTSITPRSAHRSPARSDARH